MKILPYKPYILNPNSKSNHVFVVGVAGENWIEYMNQNEEQKSLDRILQVLIKQNIPPVAPTFDIKIF